MSDTVGASTPVAVAKGNAQSGKEPKVSKKAAKKAVKAKAKVAAERKPGPAMKAMESKIKAERTIGQCLIKGCKTKTVTRLSKWCATHKKEIRKAQLAANNVVWKKRVDKGEAGHHVAYRNQPTVWAVEHKAKALELATKGKSIYEPERLKKILSKVKAA